MTTEHKDLRPSAHKINTACSKLDVSRSTICRMAKAEQIGLIRVGKSATRVTDASLRQALGRRPAVLQPSDLPIMGSQPQKQGKRKMQFIDL